MPEQPPLLSVIDARAGYGKKEVLKGASLEVRAGERVALIGHNGAGKSTLLKTIFGLLPLWGGRVVFDGSPMSNVDPHILLELGVSYVPQGNRVFTELTVEENLTVGSVVRLPREKRLNGLAQVLELFSPLKSRLHQRAGTLSGGEKQMLALGRALITSPRFLLLDEPSLGLAPNRVGPALDTIRVATEQTGAAALIVEQKVRAVLKVAHRVYILRHGSVTFSGPAAALDDDQKLREFYL